MEFLLASWRHLFGSIKAKSIHSLLPSSSSRQGESPLRGLVYSMIKHDVPNMVELLQVSFFDISKVERKWYALNSRLLDIIQVKVPNQERSYKQWRKLSSNVILIKQVSVAGRQRFHLSKTILLHYYCPQKPSFDDNWNFLGSTKINISANFLFKQLSWLAVNLKTSSYQILG